MSSRSFESPFRRYQPRSGGAGERPPRAGRLHPTKAPWFPAGDCYDAIVDSRRPALLPSVLALLAVILVGGCQATSDGSSLDQSASPPVPPTIGSSSPPDSPSPSVVSEPSSGTPTVQPDGRCPRPSDQGGPTYFEMEGVFARIHTDPGGGQWVVLKRSPAGPEELLPATEDLLARLRSLDSGTTITLVAYRVSSRSGSGGSPPFSCLEVHP